MGIEKKHNTYSNIVLSHILVFMFLAPMSLKFYHSLSLHSEAIKCEHTKTHIHSGNSHNDFLDIFFQPVFELDLNFFKMKKYLLLLFAFSAFTVISCEKDDDHDDHDGHDHSALIVDAPASIA